MHKEKVIHIINKMIELCEPIKYEDFNRVYKAKDIEDIRKAEAEYKEIGLANFGTENEGITTISIISTITDLLIQDRLAFILDDENIIRSVQWKSMVIINNKQ